MERGPIDQGVAARQLINHEEILMFGELLLVKSKSRPGVWYEITENECHCEAAIHGNICHHVRNLFGGRKTRTE